MASNKLNKTPKMAIILIYALLEWTLIALLLLNGLFSYLISLFANFFALKPPCLLCSRVDHLFAPPKPIAHLLCDAHALEISKLGFCSRHGNLAEASDVCEDCGASGMADRTVDVISPFLLFKPSSCGGLEYAHTHKGELGEKRSDSLNVEVGDVCEDVGGVDGERHGDENCDKCVEERLVPDSWILIENELNSVEGDEHDKRVCNGYYYKLVEKDDTGVDVEEMKKTALLSSSTAEISESQNVADVVVHKCSSSDQKCVDPESIMVILEERSDAHVEDNYGEFQAYEEDHKLVDVEANCDHEQINLPRFTDQCLASYNVIVDKEQVSEAEPMKENNIASSIGLSIKPQLIEVEEERLPETPTSIESLHALYKRFLMDRRESGTESFDGSVANESVDNLKAALKAEHKALSALFAELEEERSASAIATNQTMAMITRLQEEKSAMQMEAFQYQRMMEEQSEYDQEALQFLNELMMKREKEKQDLEKELEVYKKKVRIYEAQERNMAADRSKISGKGRGTSSSSATASDSDEDEEFHEGEEFNYRHDESNQNTPSDQEVTMHKLTLDKSLDDFEERRLSIQEQLKALKGKLFTMDDFADYVSSESGHGLSGFEHNLDTNGNLYHRQRITTRGGKTLLPFFDATADMKSEDGSPQSVSQPAISDREKKLAIVEEVDNVYERLQALEADTEFLKHSVKSLNKGDKGIALLQEILQHLRDLRNVEPRVGNMSGGLAS